MGILTNKPSGGGVIITRAEVDESGFCIVILPEIAERVFTRSSFACIAERIVGIAGLGSAIEPANRAEDIAVRVEVIKILTSICTVNIPDQPHAANEAEFRAPIVV